MKIHHLDAADALRTLHARAEGLTETEARRRLREYGPNSLRETRRKPLIPRFAREFIHFFALAAGNRPLEPDRRGAGDRT